MFKIKVLAWPGSGEGLPRFMEGHLQDVSSHGGRGKGAPWVSALMARAFPPGPHLRITSHQRLGSSI